MILSYLNLIASILYFFFAVIVLFKNRYSIINLSFFFYMALFGVWSFSAVFVQNPYTPYHSAKFIYDLGSVGWIFFAPGMTLFVISFLNLRKFLKHYIIGLVFAPGIFLWIVQFKGLLVSDIFYTKYGWHAEWQKNITTYIFIAYYSILLLFDVYLLTMDIFKTSNVQRKKIDKFIIGSGLIMGSISTISDVVFPIILNSSVPTLAQFPPLIGIMSILYVMSKYNLLMFIPRNFHFEILKSMTDGLILTDHNNSVVFVNNVFVKLSGYKKTEILMKPLNLFFSNMPEISTGHSLGVNLRTKSGRILSISTIKSNIPKNIGKNLGQVWIITEMTKYNKLREKQKISSRKLLKVNKKIRRTLEKSNLLVINFEKAIEQKNLFLARVGHELRTPLNGIIGSVELLNMTILQPTQSMYVKNIRNVGNFFIDAVSKITDISSIENSTLISTQDRIRLDELGKFVENMFELDFYKNKISYTYSIDAGLPQIVSGDLLKLQQIILCVIYNFIRFTTQGEIKLVINNFKDNHIYENNNLEIMIKMEVSNCDISVNEINKLINKNISHEPIDEEYVGFRLSVANQLLQIIGSTFIVNYFKGDIVSISFLLKLNQKSEKKVDWS